MAGDEQFSEEERKFLGELERQYAETNVVSITQRSGMMPQVEWSKTMSDNDVIATLLKALLFITIDEFVLTLVEDAFVVDDEEED